MKRCGGDHRKREKVKPMSGEIPFSKMQDISDSGIFIKHFDKNAGVAMKNYAHRDDYYLFALLTGGSAAIEIDFERVEINTGDILVGVPGQVHLRPAGTAWQADGWLIDLTPELLTEHEIRVVDEATVVSHVFSPGREKAVDISLLCAMLERNRSSHSISTAIASAIKSIVVSARNSAERQRGALQSDYPETASSAWTAHGSREEPLVLRLDAAYIRGISQRSRKGGDRPQRRSLHPRNRDDRSKASTYIRLPDVERDSLFLGI